jgi:hypothetical protein
MTVRPLRLIGDLVLRTPCNPVTSFDSALEALVTDLLDTVRLPGGQAWPPTGSGWRSRRSPTTSTTGSATC